MYHTSTPRFHGRIGLICLLQFVTFLPVYLSAQYHPCYQEDAYYPDAKRHDYWIRFPADVTDICGHDVAIPGVTFQENGCDLLAVYQEDRRFAATQDPEGCYKIFRTYQVINWREYDGEAEPTIVSRDWDSWNGVDCGPDYNVNPSQAPNGSGAPDGDDDPGDEAIYVIVRRDLTDQKPDTVYYDNDADPSSENNSADDPSTPIVEDYWWKVVSGDDDPGQEAYYEGLSACQTYSVWSRDDNQFDSDITGNVQGDDADERYGSFGFWQYTQHIVVYDPVGPDIAVMGADTFCSISNTDCAAPVSLEIVATDLCTDDQEDVVVTIFLDQGNDGTLDAEVTGQWDGRLFSDRYSLGEHRLEIRADDGCGNTAVRSKVFRVVDCLAPSPIIIDAISVEMMPSEVNPTGGEAMVWAKDFVASPIYDCNGQDDSQTDDRGRPLVTAYSINRVGEQPDREQKTLVLSCTEAVQSLAVEIHAWDEAGNHGYATTFLLVQDNQQICGPEMAEIVGTVRTAWGMPVPAVEVQLSGEVPQRQRTDANGTFRFDSLEAGTDLSLMPVKPDNPRHGVSTLDLIRLTQHLLGSDPIRDPYQQMAADINGNGAITTLDLIYLRDLILRRRAEWPGQEKPWRFLDAGYAFGPTAESLREDYPGVININNLQGETRADFIAVKVGDLDGSGIHQLQPRSDRRIPFWVPEGAVRAGEVIDVPLILAGKDDVLGFQFTLEVNPALADMIDLEYGAVGSEQVGWFPQKGMLTVTWQALTGEGASRGDSPILTLKVRARRHTRVRDFLSLTSRLTQAEAYTRHGEITGLQLQYRHPDDIPMPQLFPNSPNPFREKTQLRFSLPKAAPATLTVQDVSGRVVWDLAGHFDAGEQDIFLAADELPGTGVFFCTLSTGTFVLTRKIVVVK